MEGHGVRVCKKLGCVREDGRRVDAHQILNAIGPPDDRYSLHINLVNHGRKVCKASRPHCGECVIEGLCPGAEIPILR